MASSKAEASVNAGADEVWAFVGQFGGLDTWMPGVDSCVVEGDVRTVGVMGISVKEQLRDHDDAARRIAYGIVESPMDNLVSHLATITVTPEGDGCRVTWEVEVTPDDMLPLFQGMYEGSVAEIKKKAES